MQDQESLGPTPRKRVPWNKGKLTGANPPLRPDWRVSPPCAGAGWASAQISRRP